MISKVPNFDDRALTRFPQGRGVTVRQSGRVGFARFHSPGKLSSSVVGLTLGGSGQPGLPFNLSVGGDIQFCCGSDAAVFVAHSTRAAAASPRLQRVSYFQRQCGGVGKRGQRHVSRGTMSSSNTLPQIDFKRPLVSLNTVMAALDRDGLAIVGMIEDGSLPWAFNVGMDDHRREIRVLAHCVSDFQNGRLSQSRALDFSGVLALIFPMLPLVRPGVVASIKASAVARRFNLKTETAIKLMDAGCFREVSNSVRRCGPGGSPTVELSSVVEFLKQRRIV